MASMTHYKIKFKNGMTFEITGYRGHFTKDTFVAYSGKTKYQFATDNIASIVIRRKHV